ncbi:MAG: ISAs1 family transposase [Muribaculaceae bacterium]|nr:ISAs1 family transposase [Muribaculaceae bacterium]
MLNEIFMTVPDHRVTGRCTYALSDLLTIALLTYICGGEDYVDMSEFAYYRARDFGLLADRPDRSPSPDTFERLMSAVDPDEIERCLVEHGRKFLDTLAEKQVVIDGKKLRGTSPKQHGSKGDYIMNAYVSENHIVVGQQRLKDKENEIVAIPQLLEKLDIEGAIISIDAIGTQVNIAQNILDRKAHYFLAVKDNQGALNEQVIDAFRYNKPTDSASQMDAGHGRIETRDCRILNADTIEDKDVLARWPGLKTLVEVTSTVDYGDHTATSLRRYISDEDFPKAAYFNMLARGHWSIENQLHWNLDVTFLEDACRARKGNAALNLSTIRKLAMQIIKEHVDKSSLKKRRFKASLSNDYLTDMLLKAKF